MEAIKKFLGRIRIGFMTSLALSAMLFFFADVSSRSMQYQYMANISGEMTVCPMAPVSSGIVFFLAIVILIIAFVGFIKRRSEA